MKHSESRFFDVRGLRHHCRTWGNPDDPILVLLHGWMDVSASFQFFVDALESAWYCVAPDLRGFGETDWSGADAYWFPDYFGDLDRLIEIMSPDAPVRLLGHSMGGNVACIYAGVRPSRVAKLVNVEGFGMMATPPEIAPQRYARWLDELAAPATFRPYRDFDALAARLRKDHPKLTVDRSFFLAQHWGAQSPDGHVTLRADPAHKRVNPVLYRLEEAVACWRAVTAPVLWIEGTASKTTNRMELSAADLTGRKAAFRDLQERFVPEAGHMVHLEAPEALARLVEEFLLTDDATPSGSAGADRSGKR